MKNPRINPSAQIGLLTASPSRMLLVQAAVRGLDFVVLDAEQTDLEPSACADAVAMLSGHATRVAVRVPDLDAQTALAFANTGVDELVLPRVRSLDEVGWIHDAVTSPPRGHRPRQVSLASRYGMVEPAIDLSVLIETAEAFDMAAELAADDRVAGAWVGPTDLATDLARADHRLADDLDSAIAEVVTTFRAMDANIGLPAKDLAGAQSAFDRGADRCAVYWEAFVGTTLQHLHDLTTITQ